MAYSQKRGRHLGDENLSTRDEGAAASKGPFNILLLSRSLSLSERQSDSSVFRTGSGNAVGHRLAGFFSAPETMLDPVRHPCVSPCLCNEGRLDRFSGKNKPGVFSCSSSFDVYRKQHSFPETLLELTGQSRMLFLEIRH